MEEKVVGILKNISELLVVDVVSEDEKVIVVKNPAFLGINGVNGQININFIPVEMLSLAPAVNIRNLLADPTVDILYTFEKSSLLHYDLKLSQNVVDNYKAINNKVQLQPVAPVAPVASPDNIVKLF
jgi:hypothetical protein